MRTYAFILLALLLFLFSNPVLAKGRHIHCDLTGANTDGPVERQFDFFLDDTNEKLISESGAIDKGTNLNVQTTLYSDTQVKAELTTSFGGMYFGFVAKEPALIHIDRVTGRSALAVQLLPRGAEVLDGDCNERVPPKSKF